MDKRTTQRRVLEEQRTKAEERTLYLRKGRRRNTKGTEKKTVPKPPKKNGGNVPKGPKKIRKRRKDRNLNFTFTKN